MKKTTAQEEAAKIAKKYKYSLLYGGSRSGKTAIYLYGIIIRAYKEKSRHCILRYRFNHVKTSIWYDSLPKIMESMYPGVPYHVNKSDWFITLSNGSEIWIGGLDDKERTEKILGNEYSTILFNECSQISYDSVTTALTRLAENAGLVNHAFFDCNPPSIKHWAHKVFIEHVDPESGEKLDPALYGSLRMNPGDNPHLPQDYIDSVLRRLPARKRRRFLLGEWGDDNENALWRREWIDGSRVHDVPDLIRVVVGVDPAASHSAESNETGIIVVGEAVVDDVYHYYVLDDVSMVGTPREWAQAVVGVFKRNNADRIIAEKNNGGDMVLSTIKSVDQNAPVSLVWASRGKHVRAEPVSAIYEEGRVHHVGILDQLEDELTDWNPVLSNYSPNRLDALVWAVSSLMESTGDVAVGIA